jgi:hypothetical protein
MIKYLKIKDNLYLANQVVKSEEQKEQIVDLSTQHIFVIDCSGSMSGELSTIRKDLFNKISTILKPSDSVTIIWFSGKNEYGVILEDYTLHSNIALEKVREIINKYLTPQGLTAFKQPLEEVKTVIERVRASKPNMLHSMFFLTDGYDNQFSTKEILKATTELGDFLNSATIVEYGWYCNRELLSQMAQEIGGVHTFSQNFQDYEPYLTKQFTSDNRGKRTYIELENEVKFDMVFNIVDGDIVLYKTNDNNEILININGETNIFYFTENADIENTFPISYIKETFDSNSYSNSEFITGLYSSLFAFSRKSDYGMVSEILKVLGDSYLITEKSNTFGTQKINELEAKFIDAANNSTYRYTKGYNTNLEPAEDAYCVLDMMQDLMTQEGNYWYPQHEAFNYKRIGSKTIAKMADLSEEDRQKIDNLLDNKKLDEAQKLLEEIKNNQPTQLKFIYDSDLQAFPFYDLVWNETRANLSVQVNYKGYVELPENTFGVPTKFPTNQFRNYTLIKDGIVYNYTLPISLGKETFETLQANGLLENEIYQEGKIYVLDFSKLPVINRKMINTLSARELFTNEWELLKLKSSNAVYNYYKKLKFQNTSKGFNDVYGKEATEWLATFGLKDYGFSPSKSKEKQGEQIDVNILEVKIDKMNTTPGKKEIESAERKISSKDSLTPKEALVENAIKEFNQFTGLIKEIENEEKMLEDWLYQKSKLFRTEKNRLMSEISKAKFLTIVGKSWFLEFSDRNQNEMTLTLDSQDVKFKVEDRIETITI